MSRDDDRRKGNEDPAREDLPGPHHGPSSTTVGTTDDRAADNRRKGLEKDRDRARDGDDVEREED